MTNDRLFGIFKIGDQQTGPGKEPFAIKDGMLVEYIDESDYDLPVDKILSPNMHRVYCVVEFNKTMKQKLNDASRMYGIEDDNVRHIPQSIIPDITKFRPRKGLVDFKELVAASGDSQLLEKLRSKDTVVPIINGTQLTDEAIKSSLVFSNEPAADLNAVTTGIYTIGSGKDYATTNAFIADFGNLTGDLTGEVQTAYTEVAGTIATENLGGYNLTFRADLGTNGDPTSGKKISANADIDPHYMSYTGTGNIYFQDLYYVRTGTNTGHVILIYGNDISSNINITMKKCFLNNNSKMGRCWATNTWGGRIIMYNNIFTHATQAPDASVWIQDFSSTSILENNSVIFAGSNAGFDFSSCYGTARNNYSLCTVGFANHSNMYGYNNASYDTSAADANWRSIAYNNRVYVGWVNTGTNYGYNEFVSIDPTNANFLDLKTTGTSICANGGAVPQIADNTAGIEGNTRPRPL